MRKARLDIFRTPSLGFTEFAVGLLLALAIPPACGLLAAMLSHQRVSTSADLFLAACSFAVGSLYLLGRRRRS
jgi:hypothetical protein